MLTGEQVRAARALLSWPEERLADAACISPDAIRQFEDGGMVSRHATSDVLRRVLEAHGVEFIAENGSVCVHYRSEPQGKTMRPEELAADND
jgi:ribosome-binding protein aMBF1 (putative translation factor)